MLSAKMGYAFHCVKCPALCMCMCLSHSACVLPYINACFIRIAVPNISLSLTVNATSGSSNSSFFSPFG